MEDAAYWSAAHDKEVQRLLHAYKDVEALLILHEKTKAPIKPICEWKNGNVCVAEGCFGEDCLKLKINEAFEDFGKDHI